MKKTVLYFILFIVCKSLSAQKFEIGLQTGIGTYKMEEYGEFMNLISNGINFKTKMVHDFPSRVYLKPTVRFAFEKGGLGLNYTYNSTGARISRSDYSGEYNFDCLMSNNSLGINGYAVVNPENKLQLGLNIEFGLNYSIMELKEGMVIYEETLIDEQFFYEWFSKYLEPGMKLTYSYAAFSFELNFGYFFPFGTKPLYPVNLNGLSDELDSEWAGTRTGITVLYTIKNWKKE